MAPCALTAAQGMTSRQLPCTAWPSQVQPQQCSSARVVHCSSTHSSRGSCEHYSHSTAYRSANYVSQVTIKQRGKALRVLSSKTEPSSLQTSYEEPSTSAVDAEDFGYMQEYTALKQQLLDNTRKSGGAIGAYLLLTVNGTAALLAMIGAGASYAYLQWLCRDVDAVQPTDTVPIWEANKIENPWLRRAAKVKAAYQKALTPRLLVPVALGCLIGVYNRVTGDSLPVLYSGCLLLGFLSYKVALITKLVDDLSPKSFTAEAKRPKVEKIDDELDQWGRPKKRLANPIDVMPEDMQDKAYQQLEEQLAKEEGRKQG